MSPAPAPLRAAFALRCWLCVLASILLLQGSAALIAATLGPRHDHVQPPQHLAHGPLLDLRRGVVMSALPLAHTGREATAAPQQWQRHHHARGTDGIAFDTAAQWADAQSATAALLAIWFLESTPAAAWLIRLPARDAPVATPGWFVASAEARLLERPPRAPRQA